jgi:V8-like Glu-specific endopeptidase
MPWNRRLTELRDVLAELYETTGRARVIVAEAGLNPAFIAFADNARETWYNILAEASKEGKDAALIEVARKDYPGNVALARAAEGDLWSIAGPELKPDDWRAPKDPGLLEKIIGAQSTLLPISFLEIGMTRARSICRVVRDDGTAGTGFLIGNDLLLTNHHVLPDETAARDSVFQFNFQRTAEGLDAAIDEYRADVQSGFATHAATDCDWTAVKLKGAPGTRWGSLPLKQLQVAVGDRVNIVQHALGQQKQIALYHNVVAFVGGNVIQYLTDTARGSSGSPVFDQKWRVVALHHSGGDLQEPGTTQTYYRNEGIAITTVIHGLVAAGLYQL